MGTSIVNGPEQIGRGHENATPKANVPVASLFFSPFYGTSCRVSVRVKRY